MPKRQPRIPPINPGAVLADAPLTRFTVRVDFAMNLRLIAAAFVAFAQRHPATTTVELREKQPASVMRTYLETYGINALYDLAAAWDQVPEDVRQWAERQVQAYLEDLRCRRPGVYERLMASEVVRVPR